MLNKEIKNAAAVLGDIFGCVFTVDSPVYVLIPSNGKRIALSEEAAEDAGYDSKKMTFGQYAEAFYNAFGHVPEMEYEAENVSYAN